MSKRRREVTDNQEQPQNAVNEKPLKAWALVKERAAYSVVELSIVGDRIVDITKTEPNRQTIQLQKIEDKMVKQANDGM